MLIFNQFKVKIYLSVQSGYIQFSYDFFGHQVYFIVLETILSSQFERVPTLDFIILIDKIYDIVSYDR